jgi:DNA-binding response OmpR family regulator
MHTIKRVLIVEDDPAAQDVFRRLLHFEQISVDIAESGTEALDCLGSDVFDFILADFQLPDFSGIELLRKARSASVYTPFAIVSGFATVPLAVEAMRAGAISCLEKPVGRKELLHAVRLATDARAPRDLPVLSGIQRWADLVVTIVTASNDPRTIHDWARIAGQSTATIESRCRAVHLSPKTSLDFARMLRAISLAHRLNLEIETVMDADPRTIRRLIRRGGLASDARHLTTVAALNAFLDHQQFVRDRAVLAAITALVAQRRFEHS